MYQGIIFRKMNPVWLHLENRKMQFYQANSKPREIKFPSFLKSEFYSCYALASQHHFDCSEKKFPSIPDENFIFWLAVVAYATRDLSSLVKLDKHLNLLSDTYYWLYLAHEPNFFYSTLEIEIYRRRISNELPLHPFLGTNFHYLRGKEANILPIEDTSLSSSEDLPPVKYHLSLENWNTIRTYKLLSKDVRLSRVNIAQAPPHIAKDRKIHLLNRKTHSYYHNWRYYGSRIKNLCSNIIQAGGIIAGGFVNSLINQTFFLQELTFPEWPSRQSTPFDEKGPHYACEQIGQCRNLNKESVNLDDVHTLYPGLCDCIRAYFAKHHSRLNLTEYQRSYLEQDSKKYENYDLEAALIQYSDFLLVRKRKLYFLEFHYSNDIDVFFTGKDYLSKCSKVIELLEQDFEDLYHKNISIRCDTYVTTFKGRRDFPSVQLIKRAYDNEKEILAGFDLHSCRAALLSKEGKETILATEAYITAVSYGLNLIVPSCQSETFNFRLSKYYNRGFEVYLPGNILERFGLRSNYTKLIAMIFSKHTLSELLIFRSKDKYWSKECSDYDQPLEEDIKLPSNLKYEESGQTIEFPLDIREREIKRGRLIAQRRDVLYLGNRLIDRFGYGKHDSTWQGPPAYYSKILLQYMITLFWKTTNPGTQLTGSFNPTFGDYLASKKNSPLKRLAKEEDYMQEERLILTKHLSHCLVSLILEYLNPIPNIYALLIQMEDFLDQKTVETSFLDVMIASFTELGISITIK